PRKPREKKPEITSFEMISCPLCKIGHILKGRTAFGCSNYSSCTLRLPFEKYPETLSPKQLATKVKKNFKD
ncbi:MAG: DNA topoisomerase III, partial [Muribaculaceae bacterium]|nr:DNA topoisomerase III [Muribaculaceae bacterium]